MTTPTATTGEGLRDARAQRLVLGDQAVTMSPGPKWLLWAVILLTFLTGCGSSATDRVNGASQTGAGALSGEALFLISCSGCHRSEPGGVHDVGPNLFGIADGPAAAGADYRYSSALAASGLTWDRATLAAWIAATEILVPGTTMTYANILTGEEVALVVDYLFEPSFERQGAP